MQAYRLILRQRGVAAIPAQIYRLVNKTIIIIENFSNFMGIKRINKG